MNKTPGASSGILAISRDSSSINSQINTYHKGLCCHSNSTFNSNHSVNEINWGGKMWRFAFVYKTKNGIEHDTSINLMKEPGKFARSLKKIISHEWTWVEIQEVNSEMWGKKKHGIVLNYFDSLSWFVLLEWFVRSLTPCLYWIGAINQILRLVEFRKIHHSKLLHGRVIQTIQ